MTRQTLVVAALLLVCIVVLLLIVRAVASFLLDHWIVTGIIILSLLGWGIYQFVWKEQR